MGGGKQSRTAVQKKKGRKGAEMRGQMRRENLWDPSEHGNLGRIQEKALGGDMSGSRNL